MAKSQRSKREKRLRSIRREISTPYYDKQEAAKLAVQEAALAAPKLPTPPSSITTSTMDVDVFEDGPSHDQKSGSLKPVGGIGKKMKKKLKIGRGKRRGKGGKIRKKNI